MQNTNEQEIDENSIQNSVNQQPIDPIKKKNEKENIDECCNLSNKCILI